MRTLLQLTILALVVSLGGCGRQWHVEGPPGTTRAQADQALVVCEFESAKAAPLNSSGSVFLLAEAQLDIEAKCLRVHGYRRVMGKGT